MKDCDYLWKDCCTGKLSYNNKISILFVLGLIKSNGIYWQVFAEQGVIWIKHQESLLKWQKYAEIVVMLLSDPKSAWCLQKFLSQFVSFILVLVQSGILYWRHCWKSPDAVGLKDVDTNFTVRAKVRLVCLLNMNTFFCLFFRSVVVVLGVNYSMHLPAVADQCV